MVGFWDGLPVSPVSAASEETHFKTSRQQSAPELSPEHPYSPSVKQNSSHESTSSLAQHDNSHPSSTKDTVTTHVHQRRPVEFVAACDNTMDQSADFVAKLNTSVAGTNHQESRAVQDERRRKLMERLAAISKRKEQLASHADDDDDEVVVVQENLCSSTRSTRKRNINTKDQQKKRKASTSRTKSTVESMVIDVDSEVPVKPSKKKRARVSTGKRKTTTTQSESAAPIRTSSRVRRPRASEMSETQDNSKPGPLPACMSKCKRYQFGKKLITSILREPLAGPFSAPVQDLWPEAAIPRYFDVIKNPMDLGTIKKRLQTNVYACPSPQGPLPYSFEVEKFADDVRQVFRNAHTYNRKGDSIYNSASSLLESFENSLVNIPPMPCLETVNKDQPKRGRGKGRGRKSKATSAKASQVVDVDSDTQPTPKSRELPTDNISQHQVDEEEESDDFMDDGMTVADLKERLSYLRRCRVPVIARTPVPEGSGYLTRAALLYDIEMSWEDKKKCTDTLDRVPSHKLPVVIDMIRDGLGSNLPNADDGEFVFDADQLNNKTMRNIQAFMEDNVPGFKTIRSSTLGKEFNSIEVVEEEICHIQQRLSKLTKPQKRVVKRTNVSERNESFFDRSQDHCDSSSSEDESSSDESDSDGSDSSDSE